MSLCCVLGQDTKYSPTASLQPGIKLSSGKIFSQLDKMRPGGGGVIEGHPVQEEVVRVGSLHVTGASIKQQYI